MTIPTTSETIPAVFLPPICLTSSLFFTGLANFDGNTTSTPRYYYYTTAKLENCKK